MNIVVCIKWIVDTDCIIKVENGIIRDHALCHVVNPFDLIALEEAVRLKEVLDSGEVTVICMGPPQAEKALRNCLAVGADRGIVLWDTTFNDSDSYATATILAEAIKRLRFDLILCGQRAADTEGGQVGAILAEFLSIPVISAVIKVEVSDSRKATIHRKLEKGNREVVEAILPILLTVEAGLNKPRYPSLRSVIAARAEEVVKYDLKTLNLTPEQVGVDGSKNITIGYSPPKPRLKKIFTPPSDLSPEERIQLLMTGGLAQKKSNFLEGDPDRVASTLLRFFEEQKLVG